MSSIRSQPVPPSEAEPGNSGQIVVLNTDLFFGVKIGNTLRSLGYSVGFARSSQAFAERMTMDEVSTALGIIDINAGVDWTLISALTGGKGNVAPLLAFGSHLDVEGLRAARAAGVRRVVSNGDFHRDMVALVKRYARSPRIPDSPAAE